MPSTIIGPWSDPIRDPDIVKHLKRLKCDAAWYFPRYLDSWRLRRIISSGIIYIDLTPEELRDTDIMKKRRPRNGVQIVGHQPVYVASGYQWTKGIGLEKVNGLPTITGNMPATSYDDFSQRYEPQQLRNNDGRETCYACGANTKQVAGFTSMMNVCTGCGK